MAISMHVNGIKELDDKMQKLARSLDPEKTNPILFDAATFVADAARAKAPLGATGNLRRGIRAVSLKARGRDTAAIAAVDYRIAPHAKLVESGTVQRYRGKLKTKTALAMFGEKKVYLGGSTGRMPAEPFMQPAFMETRGAAETYIMENVQKLLEEAAR